MSATIEDTLGKMLRLMESMNAMMQEQRNEHAAAKNSTRASGEGEASGTTPAAEETPVVEDPNKPSVSGDCATVVGMLSRIVEALQDVGLISDKKDKEDKTSPLSRKRFGLNFQQAQRGNGASFYYQTLISIEMFVEKTMTTRPSMMKMRTTGVTHESFLSKAESSGCIMMRPRFLTTISLPSLATASTCR